MGTLEQLSRLHSKLRQGPRASRVDEVEMTETQPVEGLNTFRIEGAW
jgi:acylphosphatase